jgi:hypothetical protein
MRDAVPETLARGRQEKRRRSDSDQRGASKAPARRRGNQTGQRSPVIVRDETARALALEVADRLQPFVVVIVASEAPARRRGTQMGQWRPVVLRGRRWNHGKAVGPQRGIDLRAVTAILHAFPFTKGLAGAAIHDDLELVVWAERRPEGRDEVAAAKPFPGDDAQARRLIGHQNLSHSNADADLGGARTSTGRFAHRAESPRQVRGGARCRLFCRSGPPEKG